ncbi:MAG: hypothetical protein QOD39_2413 [Mycobacterium sp.]|jgi:predicted TIM-barrel fold metal-dependent hydrolase|nr:hypothetical protein [Mycobacterium sp.]
MGRPRVVDSHVHLWDLKHPELRWDWLGRDTVHPILGDIDAIKSVKFDAAALWSEARFADVSAFVHVQAAIGSPDPVAETQWIDEQFAASGLRGAIIAHADVGEPSLVKVLDGHAEASGIFTGVRDFASEPYLAQAELDSRYEDGLRELTRRELVLDLDCEWPNMDAAARLAGRHPDLRIVLEHLGYPRERNGAYFRSWAAALGRLAGADNVFCKISGIAMTDRRFTFGRLAPWAERCLEVFGPERCLVGSNWPVDRIASSYDVIMDFYRDTISGLSSSEQAKILAENAESVYGLVEP